MFSKFQKASDKIRLILQNKVDCSVFVRSLSMNHRQSSKVQAIYDLCKTSLTPTSSPLSSQTIQNLCSLLGNFSALLWNLYCILSTLIFKRNSFVSFCDSCSISLLGFKIQVIQCWVCMRLMDSIIGLFVSIHLRVLLSLFSWLNFRDHYAIWECLVYSCALIASGLDMLFNDLDITSQAVKWTCLSLDFHMSNGIWCH